MAEYLAQHTVGPDDTLSHIALKYYGSAAQEKWMLIYEANKAVIGPDPNKLRPGIVLNIPSGEADASGMGGDQKARGAVNKME